MNIITQSIIQKTLNSAGNSSAAPAKNPVVEANERSYVSSPLVDNNYGKLLINKKPPVSFAGVPATIPPSLEVKMNSVLKRLKPDEIILVGDDLKSAKKLLKATLNKIDHYINRILFIEDKAVKHPFAMNHKDESKNVINLSKPEMTIKGSDQKITAVKMGEIAYTLPGDTIKNGNIAFRILENPPAIPESKMTEFVKELEFPNKTEAIAKINATHLDRLTEVEKQAANNARKITFADVGGQDQVIKELKKGIIYPIKYPEAFKNTTANHGTILYGGPGTGKSLMAEAIAGEVDAHYVKLNGSQLETKWVGETEANWRNLFAEAKEKQPSIIFIDEAECIMGKRTGSEVGKHSEKTVAQILTLMSDLEKSGDQVHIILATNKPELLDEAITRSGRWGLHLEVKNPTLDGCKQILGIHSKGKPVSEEFKADEFAEKLFKQKATGADIAKIVTDAHSNAFDRLGIYEKMEAGTYKPSDSEDLRIIPGDFEKAISDFASSNKKQTIEKPPMGFKKQN